MKNSIKSKLFQTAAFILFAAFFTACNQSIGQAVKISKTAPADAALSETSVTGKDCVWFPPFAGFPSIQKATEDAVKKGPQGTEAIADASINFKQYIVLPLFCYEVTGKPAK